MKSISQSDVLIILQNIAKLLDESNIQYLIYGSVFNILMDNDNNLPNDIDIIVRERDFKRISSLLFDSFDLFHSEHSIHANSREYLGKNGKAFDISFDSYEHYFGKLGFDFSSYDKQVLNNTEIKILQEKFIKQLNKLGD